jgi:hypothetical protein
MQQDDSFLQELRADIVERVRTLNDAEREHLLWKLNACDVLLSKYKAHLLRKTWDREAYKRLVGRMTQTCALVIIDYGQKVEPVRHLETQSECLAKLEFLNLVLHTSCWLYDSQQSNIWKCLARTGFAA